MSAIVQNQPAMRYRPVMLQTRHRGCMRVQCAAQVIRVDSSSDLFHYYAMRTLTIMQYGWRHCVCLVALLVLQPASAEAPAIALERFDNGASQRLSDHIGKGKWTVVNVWSPSCSFCVQELPLIKKFHAVHGDEITVLGVTIDFPSFGYGRRDTLAAFLHNHPLDYPLFLADMAMASELIGMRLVGIPLIAIFHPNGRPLGRWPGKIEPNEIIRFIRHYEDTAEEPLSADF